MDNKLKLNTVLLVIIIILLATGLGYFLLSNSNEKKDSVLINTPTPEIQNNKNTVILDETLNWKEYTFMSTKYLPKSFSFKYPDNWKMEIGNYTEPASGKNIPMSVILTSPNNINQISYSAGSPGYPITCAGLRSNTEIQGKLSCIEKEGIPYFVVYQDEETLKVYNQILSTFKFN